MTCYVYIIQSGEGKNPPIKIGVANDPEKRMSELQTGSPFLLRLKAKILCDSRKKAYELESWLHGRFSNVNINGEWFWSKGCNLKRAFDTWNSFTNGEVEYKKTSAAHSYGVKSKQDVKRLWGENVMLRERIKKLERDIEEYLDSEIDRFI